MSNWTNRIVGHGEESPSQLLANPKNWRIHPERQQKVLEGSINDVGYIRSVTVNKRTGYVLDGHLRVSLAISSGQDSIPVEYVDLSEEEEAEALATIDPIAGMAATDAGQLSDLLASIEEADEEVRAFLDEQAAAIQEARPVAAGLTDPDDVPAAPEEPVSKRGDVWLLGEHRVMCGDSTELGELEDLVEGAKPEALWTDPPYGVSYVGKTPAALTLANDGAEAPALFADVLACVDAVLRAGSPYYVAHPPGALSVQFGQALLMQGWRIHQTLVWVKDSMVLGHADYHYKHEPILYGYKPGAGRLGRGGEGWYGDNSQVSVFEVDRPKASREHPTSKPVELIARCLHNSTGPGAMVLEPFGGGGSTLIACERLGRKARVMEIEPKYVDVICRRYQEYTGNLPVLESTGEAHDFTKQEVVA